MLRILYVISASALSLFGGSYSVGKVVSGACAVGPRSFHAFLCRAVHASRPDHQSEQADLVRVVSRDRCLGARGPTWVDGDRDIELGLVEVGRGVAHSRRRRTGWVGEVPADGCLAGACADGIGEREVLVEGDPELDDAEQKQGEDREDESELCHRLSLLISE